MAIPKELTDAGIQNEEQFVDNVLIPMLQRLGLSLVSNYHGSRELGKDIVFAEQDKFGHIQFHGLQAKFVGSVSQSHATDLVRDVEQAFTHPFRHPITGLEEYISRFYIVNGGAIAEPARNHVFTYARPRFGDNVRILDGKDVVSLDRVASYTRGELIREQLTGLLIELIANQQTSESMRERLAAYLDGSGGYPVLRLRTSAVEAYLTRPSLGAALSADDLHTYWTCASAANEMCVSLGQAMSSSKFREDRCKSVIKLFDQMQEFGRRIEIGVRFALNELGVILREPPEKIPTVEFPVIITGYDGLEGGEGNDTSPG